MSTFIRLTDYKSSDAKEEGFFKPENRYEAKQEDFEKISGSPVAFWLGKNTQNAFSKFKKISEISTAVVGQNTGDNDLFLRYWYEIHNKLINFKCSSREETQTNQHKWYPYNKGGGFRKWYGNFEYVINWHNDAEKIKEYAVIRNNGKHWSRYIQNLDWLFLEGITWSDVTSGRLSSRYLPHGFISDVAGHSAFFKNIPLQVGLAIMNSKFIFNASQILNPTMHFQVGNYRNLPFSEDFNNEKVKKNVDESISISKEEWDSRETSWDFTQNEMLRILNDEFLMLNEGMPTLEAVYGRYCEYWSEKFYTLHKNEEELNRLFIDIYELQDELTPHVELKDITILKQESDIVDGKLVFDAGEIVKQFVSYGVGCMFGRYSLDADGLVIANKGQEIPSQAGNDGRGAVTDGMVSFAIDDDNIIPVLEDDYFKDDIAARFVQFVKVTFGEQNLRENIRFIEGSLGTPLRKYFVKGFYEDHIKRYKKRPIYWMVSSPKKGFMSLIYMHRYEADTFARVRNSYLTEYIAKLEAHKETLGLTTTSETASDKDKKDADKQIKNIETKLKELIEFDRETMMHFSQNGSDIDLDDGVKVNYCKFEDILYPITGLCK